MRRAMNALAMTAATLSLTGTPAYGQENPQSTPNPAPNTESFQPECRSVIDQTTDNVVDTELRLAIAEMARKHITVRVQILDKDNNFDFKSEQDISDYQETLKAICPAKDADPNPEEEEDTKSNSVIDVTIDGKARFYRIDDESDRISDVKENGFFEDLKDADTTYQQDVAQLLKDPSAGEKLDYWFQHKYGWQMLVMYGAALASIGIATAASRAGSSGRRGRGGSF